MSRDGTVLTYAGIEYRSHEGKWVDADGCVASLGTSRELDAATQNKVQQVDDAILAAKHSQAPMHSMLRAVTEALKPCPFCGETAFIVPSTESHGDYVECHGSTCHASIYHARIEGVSQIENLTERWNRRSLRVSILSDSYGVKPE